MAISPVPQEVSAVGVRSELSLGVIGIFRLPLGKPVRVGAPGMRPGPHSALQGLRSSVALNVGQLHDLGKESFPIGASPG